MLLRSSAAQGSPSLRPGSPSATYDTWSSLPAEPMSPSQTVVDFSAPVATEKDTSKESKRASKVAMTQASFQRASRAARPNDPGETARKEAYGVVIDALKEIKKLNLEKAPKDIQAFRSHKLNASSGGKGPGVRTSARDQGKMNHLAAIKGKDLDTTNTEPAFLLGGFTSPMLWDRLAESSLKSNAVNSSVMGRKKTQGAANQTTRINCKSIGQAAAAQVVSTALAMAEARMRLRKAGSLVVNPIATNAVNPCALALADLSSISDKTFFGITSTVRLVYNSSPVKLSSVSLMTTCISLARRELDECIVSNAMGTRNNMLIDICKSIVGECSLDPVWCAWVLVVYLSSNPRGKDILRASGLTDVDVQSAVAFERYGGEEIRRREKQRKEKTKSKESEAASDVRYKRGARGCNSSGMSDSHFLLEFWHGALQSEDVSVLHTLAAHNKRTVRDAALCTLARQAEGTDVAENTILQQVSLNNALKSAQALVSFVGRRPTDIPGLVLLRARKDYDGSYRTACGTLRIDKEAASSAIHACLLPPLCVRPQHDTGIAIAWSMAAKKLMPSNETNASLPCVFERYYESQLIKNSAQAKHSKGFVNIRGAREVSLMESFAEEESDAAVPTQATGTTRSFVSISTYISMNDTHEAAAESMVREITEAHSRVSSMPLPSVERLPSLMTVSKCDSMRTEPICTPASPLAVGICANEALRRWMAGKSRKNDPCIKHLGFSNSAELAKDVPDIMSTEPLPLLTITDFEIERVEGERVTGSRTKSAKASICVHVCGDCATRVPETLDALKAALDPVDFVMQARSALLVASSQASFIGGVAGQLTAGYANAAIASSKKISVPDISKLFLLSAQDCYVAGLNNIQRSFDGTFYSGTYGCRVDTGFTMPGLLAHNLRSDKRQHGNCKLSEDAANQLVMSFAESHWVTFSKPNDSRKRSAEGNDSPSKRPKYYSAVPTAVRGIPHNYIPGIHTLLNDYCDFIESAREITGRTSSDTVDSIMCLPFSAFTQALRPNVEPTADASLRTCFRDEIETSVATGRAYLVDSTPEDQAIVKEPLFRRPCQVATGDCPFSNAYENVDSFFNCVNLIALIVKQACPRSTPSESVSAFHVLVSDFVNGDTGRLDMAWAADALILINTLYPKCTVVGESPYFRALSKAVPHCQKKVKSKEFSLIKLESVDTDKHEIEKARKFWSAFCRSDGTRCAWTFGLAPFLTLVLTHKGSHKLSPEIIAQFRQCLENAARACWLVYSLDGEAKPPEDYPASDASSPMHVGRHHIDPVFVGDEEQGILQRGALIGVKPHTYRQLLASMMGASIDGVECNAYINEGGMSLRVSSDATILDERGTDRTSKSISPVQTEGDEVAYGSRKNKINGAVMQKNAWDMNALISKNLYTAIETPMSADRRGRGEYGFSQFFQEEEAARTRDMQLKSDDYIAAKAAMASAASVEVSKAVNPALGQR